MSSETLPISPVRFAEAIKDLSLASLHLKILEIRNDVAHLDYSNEQLLPYAKGDVAALGETEAAPDQDCVDAIKENLVVIERKLNQLKLVRAEVENRGVSWTEFQSKEEAEQQQAESDQRAERTSSALAAARQPVANGHTDAATNGSATTTSTTGNPWTDGTFQTGTIRNGELEMDSVAGQSFATRNGSGSNGAGGGGGSLTDEQLQRALEERLGLSTQNGNSNNDDDEEGLHL
ncbi:hypothetical protein Sste5346_008452 [Sporothrix stenoceras]|uniref:Secondary alcohol dehydrogenase n=1 Tax=Sporothrix stenoceras TaxID=5173 RepID=A0ABR3YQD9_9PEZI